MRQQIIITVIIYLILFMWFIPPTKQETPKEVYTYNKPELNEVLITGEVVYPGYYTFYGSKTVYELINFASGLTNNANVSKIDFNQLISNNTTIHIKEIETKNEHEPSHNLVNINEASFMELLTIPNITEKRAANIIIYREANGVFINIEQLINVKGIGSATFEKISSYVKT